jgi:ABC-type oligopeptide transport system ATPase subunit
VTALLEVRNLVKEFHERGGIFGSGTPFRAVDDVSLSISAGEIFSLVGESGSGKTTAARCILRLVEPTAGAITFDGQDVRACSRPELRRLRRKMQIVFQDAHAALNPRMRAADIVKEPLIIHRIGTRDERARRVGKLFDLVGLDLSSSARYPHEFSGGERQRLGIARAIALEPSFLVADEPVSALDRSIQRQVIDLLLELRKRLGLACLFIAHDLRLVRRISDRVGVMYRGRLVEVAPAHDLFTAPAHPYTEALLSAIPRRRPGEGIERIRYDAPADGGRPLREIRPGHLAAI